MKKKVVVLGSTGSIGKSTLDVVANHPDDFEIVGLACHQNTKLLAQQIAAFRPRYVGIFDKTLTNDIDPPAGCHVLIGPPSLLDLVSSEADIVVNALPGSVGLVPSVETLKQGKVLALANKESLVMAGRLISRLTQSGCGTLIPVDSEHSALYQLMENNGKAGIERLIITASGGPFRDRSKEELAHVSPREALCHPTWNMGTKVTLDSATLMNKALELIEARWLFDVPPDRLSVLVHPESVVHGMVEFSDGSLFAYLAHPDMRIPIAYALNQATRSSQSFGKANLAAIGTLTFREPDSERFPAVDLAYRALVAGDSACIVLNAANEVAASAFLDGKVSFTSITALVKEALDCHSPVGEIVSLDEIQEVHSWATTFVKDRLRRINALQP
jgi:1-deoxy-D-xylulose-5-phosphate reductoisomerase